LVTTADQAGDGEFHRRGLVRATRPQDARAIYQARHDLIVDALSQQLSDQLTVIPSSVGLHVSAIANVASQADVDAVVDRGLTAGVAAQRLSVFQFDQPSPPGIAIGYRAIQTDAIDEGLCRLQQAFDDAS
jgi:GntR family transcriptional regulator/MocR family aminotransferase